MVAVVVAVVWDGIDGIATAGDEADTALEGVRDNGFG